MDLKEVRGFLEKLDQEKIIFDKHFYKRSRERPIDESIVRSFLSKPDKLEKVESGNNDRFKLWYRMSGRYSLVLVVEVSISKDLKVISAWNSNKKWQKQLRQ